MKKNSLYRVVAILAVLAAGFTGGRAIAGTDDQLPADKTAVAGSTITDFGPNTEKPILQQRMRVSSPSDLILGVTLECSILSHLVTDNDHMDETTSGTVDIRITVDGHPVPVQTAGTGAEGDTGAVTFCNRTYHRSVTDDENPLDGVDREDDYIDTKTANAFNWIALNSGTTSYDDPANGNNIVDIVVYAKYTTAIDCADVAEDDAPASCSEAKVGKRTLVIEPVHAAVGEQSEPANFDDSDDPVSGLVGG